MIDNAKKMFEIYHLNMLTSTGEDEKVQECWRELLGDNFINIKDKTDVPKKITELIYSVYKSQIEGGIITDAHKVTGESKPTIDDSEISNINML
jgi:hypothetical protein